MVVVQYKQDGNSTYVYLVHNSKKLKYLGNMNNPKLTIEKINYLKNKLIKELKAKKDEIHKRELEQIF